MAFKFWGILVASRAASRVCFLIGLLSCTSAFAEAYRLTSSPIDEFEPRIVIRGQITQQDFAFFSSQVNEFKSKPLRVFLDSPGGDVDAAMKIGRIIRSADGETRIPLNRRCSSSCALIFISGVKRFNFGELGLHRPYFASAPLSNAQIEKQMPIMRSAVKEYVEEMGITGGFFERMFNTPPSEIDILRGDDSEKIVPEMDPTYEEIETSRQARWYGLTTSEYRKRDSLRESCYILDSSGLITGLKYPECLESTLWGLSPATYRSRKAKADTRCGVSLSDTEKQLVEATPRKDRYSHPIYLQYLTCRVNVMRALPSWDETQPLASPPQASGSGSARASPR
jgi:hypothetical protein